MKKKFIATLLVVVLIITVGFGGCSSKNKSSAYESTSSYAAADEMYYEDAAVESLESPQSMNSATGGGEERDSGSISQMNPEIPVVSGRKLIVNTTLTLETKEFDASNQLIQAQVNAFGGYVERSDYQSSDIYNPKQSRVGTYVLRIPAAKTADFLASLDKGSFNVLSSTQNVQDITESFFDLEARRDSLVEQKERLEKLMDTSADLEYLIQVEQEIARVSYEINVIHNQLRNMDSLVDFSTITIYLNEVVEYVEPVKPDFTFWQRVKNTISDTWYGVVDGLQNFVLVIIASVPTLIFLAILLIIGLIVYRKMKKKMALNPKTIPTNPYPNVGGSGYIPPTIPKNIPQQATTASPPANPTDPTDPTEQTDQTDPTK